jgi:hypothetical protein
MRVDTVWHLELALGKPNALTRWYRIYRYQLGRRATIARNDNFVFLPLLNGLDQTRQRGLGLQHIDNRHGELLK